jgi:predicted small lipoprotein YifL
VALTDRPIIYKGAVAVIIVAALAVSACGRKGALMPPPASTAVTSDAATDEEKNPETPKGAQKPDRRFFLDPLI